MIEPTDETRRLVWDELVDSDRMCRYYGYLTLRFRKLDQLLQFVAVFAAFAGLSGVLLRPTCRLVPHGGENPLASVPRSRCAGENCPLRSPRYGDLNSFV